MDACGLHLAATQHRSLKPTEPVLGADVHSADVLHRPALPLPHLKGTFRPVRVLLWRLSKPLQRFQRPGDTLDRVAHPSYLANLSQPEAFIISQESQDPAQDSFDDQLSTPQHSLSLTTTHPPTRHQLRRSSKNQQVHAAEPATQPRRLRAHRRVLQHVRRTFRRFGSGVGHSAGNLGQHIQPQGMGHNDLTWGERILNLVSCVPFLAVGAQVLGSCHSPSARRFGRMFLLVAGTAASYHAAPSGPVRRVLRCADYWAIAVSSCMLRSTVYRPLTPSKGAAVSTSGQIARMAMAVLPGGWSRHVLTAAPALRVAQRCLAVVSLVGIPFAPAKVSGANFALVEVRCLWLACHAPKQLLGQWARHIIVGAAAGTSFIMEDVVASKYGPAPGMHAAWHLLSAAAVMTTAPFLVHLDTMQLAGVPEPKAVPMPA